jgi:CheY-like chemotaxis protein
MIGPMATAGPCGGILVVDDDPDIRDSLREVLEDEGYEVACVGNGREALDHLKSANPRPCVILLDLMMPVMDGWEFRALQLRTPTLAPIPVMVITADASARSRAMSLGVEGYMTKPIQFTRLLEFVERYC